MARNKAEAARMITIDSEAWSAGFAAGETDQTLTACPYPARSTESLVHGTSGFIEGKAKRRRFRAACRRESLSLKNDPQEVEILKWIEKAYDYRGWK
jgi:hypothetical protein